MSIMWRVFYTFILKNSFYSVTFQKWVDKASGFAIINAWQHFGNRKSGSTAHFKPRRLYRAGDNGRWL